jgi:hypothetical protein
VQLSYVQVLYFIDRYMKNRVKTGRLSGTRHWNYTSRKEVKPKMFVV